MRKNWLINSFCLIYSSCCKCDSCFAKKFVGEIPQIIKDLIIKNYMVGCQWVRYRQTGRRWRALSKKNWWNFEIGSEINSVHLQSPPNFFQSLLQFIKKKVSYIYLPILRIRDAVLSTKRESSFRKNLLNFDIKTLKRWYVIL